MQLSFYNFILAEEPLAKPLQSLRTCVLVNDNFCEKLVSLLKSPATSYKLEILRLKCYTESFYIDVTSK